MQKYIHMDLLRQKLWSTIYTLYYASNSSRSSHQSGLQPGQLALVNAIALIQ